MTKNKVVLWRICMETKERKMRKKERILTHIKHECTLPCWKVVADTHQTLLRKVTIGNPKKSCTPPNHNNFHNILGSRIHAPIFLSLPIDPIYIII